MALNENDIVRLARLARIELPPARRAAVLDDINRILPLIAQLQSADTTGIEPMAHPLSAHQDITLRLREDAVTAPGSTGQREALLANAPSVDQGLFLVPKVLE